MKDKFILQQVAKDFFIGNPVKIGLKFEGQGITERGYYKLGVYAGPDNNIANLFHEMCHLAEREPKKLVEKPLSGWGFSHGKPWKVGYHSGFEPSTDQQVKREARVWSFQASLMDYYGMHVDFRDLVESAIYLPAFCHYSFSQVGKSYEEKESLDYLANEVERGTKFFSFSKFVEDWQDRMSILANF